MVVCAVRVLALSCCKRTLFQLTNAWVSQPQNFMNLFQLLRIKILINCTPVWNKLPLNQAFKILPDTQYYLGPNWFFNYAFGRLTRTEPLFRDVRVAVIYIFFITCDNSSDIFITHGIINTLTTDIHFTLSLLRCQFMRYRSTASSSLYIILI